MPAAPCLVVWRSRRPGALSKESLHPARWHCGGSVSGGRARAAQDALGVPVAPFQDPLHYPHGTKYLMPGAPPGGVAPAA